MLLANTANKNMNNNYNQSTSTKIDRKLVEKNRRNQMKILYSKLYSLIPNQNTNQEAIPVPDQIDEAINHIKSLEKRLKNLKEQKESLMCKKRSYDCVNFENKTSLKLPQIEVYEMAGSLLEVVLKTGLDYQFIFSEVVRILDEEHADVVNLKLSVSGDSVFHVLHAEIRDSTFVLIEAAKIKERLKTFVSGSTSSDVQEDFEPDNLWVFDTQPEIWQF